MPSVEYTILINRACPEVFAFVTDVEGWPRWWPDLCEVRRMSSKRLGPGSAFRMIGDVQGRVTEATYRVTAFDPPTTFSLESASGPMHIRAGLLIQPVDGGSQIHQTVEFHLHGLMRLARPYVAVAISRDLRVRFAAMKQCLERQDDLIGVK